MQKEHDALLYSLDTELLLLEQHWQDYDIDRRIALLNFLIYAVEVDLMSPRWIRIRVTWLREEWGCEQMYMSRPHLGSIAWTEEEERLIREHYPTCTREFLLSAIPDRTWKNIRRQANHWGLKRKANEVSFELPEDSDFTILDLQFMQKEDIPMSAKSTNWTTVLIRMCIEQASAWG